MSCHAMPVYLMQVITSFSIPSDPIDLVKTPSLHGPQLCCVFRCVTEERRGGGGFLPFSLLPRLARGQARSEATNASTLFISHSHAVAGPTAKHSPLFPHLPSPVLHLHKAQEHKTQTRTCYTHTQTRHSGRERERHEDPEFLLGPFFW